MPSIASRIALLAATFLPLAAAAPALADVLVVRSSGASAESYPAGRRLPDRATVTLAANDSVTVLGPAGTRVLRGPGTFPVSGPSRLSPLAQEISNRSRRRDRIGAVRGAGTTRGLWQVDVTRSGTFCVARGRPMLWRPDAAQPAMLTIDSATTEWPAGNAAIRWPESVPFASGAEYSLQLSTRSEPASIRLITLQSPPPDLIDLA